MIANEHLTHVLPLEVHKDSWGSVTEWKVVTQGGFTAGRRLLKGLYPPDITDFGPFNTEEEATKLADRLITHIKNDWPEKRKRNGRKQPR